MRELKPCEAIEILESIYPSKKQIVTGEYPEVAEALDMAIAALRRAQPANEPLTLEQLREMAQDLMAWCVVHECEKADCTAIIDYDNLGKYGEKGKIVAVTSAYGEPLKESNYGKTWFAYHRPPEMFIGVDLASGHDFTAHGRPPERSENNGEK